MVVPVQVHLVGDPVGGVAPFELGHDVRLARDGGERGDPIVVTHEFVGHGTRLDHSWPADQAGNPERALPVRVLLGAEGRHRAVRPRVHVRSIVRGVDDDGVIRDAHLIERLEERADGLVVLDHAVEVLAVAVLVSAAVFGAHVRAQMHARRVVPDKEGLARGMLPLHVVDRRGGGLVVDGLHPLLGERAAVRDDLLADLAETRIDGRVILVGSPGVEDAARTELRAIGRILRIVGQLRLFLGVEVIEVTEKLVEPVDGG